MHKHLSIPFYRRARNYMEFDEVDEDGHRFVSLAHAQGWLLLSCFESRHMWFSKASMSVSRCVRLSQILGLHVLDGDQNQRRGQTIPPPADWSEKEERRRTLWAVFCQDRFSSGSTGWPTLMDHRIIQTLLPASEEAFALGVEEPATTLGRALQNRSLGRSALACRILAVHLFRECLEHTHSDLQDGEEFWRRHSELDNELATTFVTLPDVIRCPQNIHDTHAVFVNLCLHTSRISLHRAATVRAAQSADPNPIHTDAGQKLLPPARAIHTLIMAHADIEALFGHPMLDYAAFIAAFAFLTDFTKTQDQQSESALWQLMDIMANVGQRNPMTASLAIQLAYEVKKSGIDPSVLDKVRRPLLTTGRY